ncbi:MAG: radical SAM protein [Candidatus Thiodiazotropha sp. (ex Dulcina madagascariensis)]|nr:radical SAM protein [Candidatus Thiodiazotropha sp. (ex Epidulcina cf. delphinae)]MCU7924096.1 radical SAM protein [Candidatus Thiodiazotropha sp. (ex Dulcina madagascariensis)]MCU7927971.1 radical SAM protein [Candidatus Thiodiazotropha sp. (ex Dulcina madagascariensis)]
MPESDLGRAEVLVATTWDCNLRCSYCFVQDHTFVGANQRMTPVTAKQVIDALDKGLIDAETISVHLYGGEPLTNLPAVRAMVERSLAMPAGRFSFAVTTNGTVDTDEVIELLGKARFEVILSIDGPQEIHDQCRRTAGGVPTHERVLRFLHKLRERTDCWIRGSSVVRHGWGLGEAETYLRTLPVDVVKAQAVRVADASSFALQPAEKEAYLADLTAVGKQVIADLEAGRQPLDDRYSARVLQLLKGESRERFCGAGDSIFGITPDGAIRPCILLQEEPGSSLGHVSESAAIWREAGKRWREAHGPREACSHCEALPLCGGGCPAMLSVCGSDECDLIRHNCRVARTIYNQFRERPTALLPLAGIT